MESMIGFTATRKVKAILLDRDGTINVERSDYVRTPEQFLFLPHALEAFTELGKTGLPVAVVTNQSGIGRGLIEQSRIEEIHAELAAQAARAGLHIAYFGICPHRPEEGCGCRKPLPGLLLSAVEFLGVLPGECVMIGDSLGDFLAARAAGSQSILVRTGRQGASLESLLSESGYDPAGATITDDLLAAVRMLASAPLGVTSVPAAESIPSGRS